MVLSAGPTRISYPRRFPRAAIPQIVWKHWCAGRRRKSSHRIGSCRRRVWLSLPLGRQEQAQQMHLHNTTLPPRTTSPLLGRPFPRTTTSSSAPRISAIWASFPWSLSSVPPCYSGWVLLSTTKLRRTGETRGPHCRRPKNSPGRAVCWQQRSTARSTSPRSTSTTARKPSAGWGWATKVWPSPSSWATCSWCRRRTRTCGPSFSQEMLLTRDHVCTIGSKISVMT